MFTDKKYRYILVSVVSVIFVNFISSNLAVFSFWKIFWLVCLYGLLCLFFIHYPNLTLENFAYAYLTPLLLITSGIMGLSFFPNLGILLNILVYICLGGGFYLGFLMDNIFLVVHDREEKIPLYRVAQAWSLILYASASIPLFAGILKLNETVFTQNLYISLITFVFCFYIFNTFKYDNDAKSVKVGEKLFLSFWVTFIVYMSSFALAFFPTEAFLKAIVVSLVLMYGLNYINAHLKNEITKNSLLFYFSLISIFLIIIFIFTP